MQADSFRESAGKGLQDMENKRMWKWLNEKDLGKMK
jgi:hypothetical protein